MDWQIATNNQRLKSNTSSNSFKQFLDKLMFYFDGWKLHDLVLVGFQSHIQLGTRDVFAARTHSNLVYTKCWNLSSKFQANNKFNIANLNWSWSWSYHGNFGSQLGCMADSSVTRKSFKQPERWHTLFTDRTDGIYNYIGISRQMKNFTEKSKRIYEAHTRIRGFREDAIRPYPKSSLSSPDDHNFKITLSKDSWIKVVPYCTVRIRACSWQ